MLKLPGRLDELLQRYSHMLPNGAEDEIPLIKGDLEKIIAFLQKSEEDHAAAIVKCWTKEVRELSYDIEDFLDQSKTPYLPEKLRQRLWMANKIREFSERVQEALERHSMYNNLRACSTASCRNPDPCFGARHPTLAVDVDDVHNHVGIDVAINKLEEWLMATDGTMVHNLKVVSITGFAGVGKINLANQLYNRLRHRFECRAFVRVSQKPDMRRIFITILSQVCPHQYPDNWKVHTLISIIRTHLQDKRYLIILDDLSATSTWEIIKSALPDGKSHSRILTTTDIEDLALHCCGYESKLEEPQVLRHPTEELQNQHSEMPSGCMRGVQESLYFM
ncbi:hypothetical protein QOZ80_6BG0485620 [Eleusine coracana subsp. coracana]|nr:hypothetical protein QOZ80_6BG0485620 [Eleusine coracana subsp. coracana]